MFLLAAISTQSFLAFFAGVTTVLTAVNTSVAVYDHYRRLKPKKEPPP
jgi:hypothetical protein